MLPPFPLLSHLFLTSLSQLQYNDPNLLGTPSPWAVFDAWGAGDQIEANLSDEEMRLLDKEAVAIPFHSDHSAPVADVSESEILETYDKLLKRRSSVHFGYPYNLMYDHSELHPFMKYR